MKVSSLLFVLSLAFVLGQPEPDENINNSNDVDGLNVRFIGRAPKFMVFPRKIKDSDRKAFIMFTFNSIEEV